MILKKFNLKVGAQIFKAFSDDARIRIMFLLTRQKELCITDIEHVLDFSQTKTSRHVAYLKNAGLLSARKKDQWIYYSIKEEVMGLVDQVFRFLSNDAQLRDDLQTLDVLDSNRELSIYKKQQFGN